MQISEIRMKKRSSDGVFLATRSTSFDRAFVVSGIKVLRSKEGKMYVSYPCWRNSDGEYKDVCFPMTKELRDEITEKVLAKYEEL